jgi:hypothetical protein
MGLTGFADGRHRPLTCHLHEIAVNKHEMASFEAKANEVLDKTKK